MYYKILENQFIVTGNPPDTENCSDRGLSAPMRISIGVLWGEPKNQFQGKKEKKKKNGDYKRELTDWDMIIVTSFLKIVTHLRAVKLKVNEK